MSDTGGGQQTTQNTTSWFATLDAEHLGHVQTKGWDKLDAAAAAAEAVKAHRGVERMVGVPADQLLRLPKAEDSDAWKGVWQKLGAPDKPEGYTFEGVKLGDDENLTGAFLDTLRKAAAEHSLPKPMAEGVAKAVAKWLGDAAAATDAELSAAISDGQKALKDSWGSNFEAFTFVANRGKDALMQRLGERLSAKLPEAVKTLDEAGHGELAMEMFRVIGAGLGEDKFVRDPGPGGRPAMTRDQAVARQRELMADKDWVGKYLKGDAAAKREMQALNIMIAGEAE